MPGHQESHLFESVLALTIHDIKNSLALLLDQLEQQAENQPNGQSKYEIRRINNNLIRLLGLYKIGASRYVPNFDFHHIIDLLEEVTADYQEILNHKGITLEINCADDLQTKLDKQLIFSVLENALNNATRYTHSLIRISVEQDGDWIRIGIEDNGDGFSEPMLAIEHTELDQAPFEFASGTTGLGLYFAHLVTQLHTSGEAAGHIKLSNDSTLGGGRFSIYLPCQAAADFSFDF